MGRADEVLIPSRFLLTVGHFITVVLAFYHKDVNVAAGLAGSTSTSEWDSAQRSLLAALGLSIVAFIVQFSGLFFGWTMFVNRLNMCHVVLHFFGGVLTAWYLVDQWGYLSFWYLVVFFNLLPAVMEAVTLLSLWCFRVARVS